NEEWDMNSAQNLLGRPRERAESLPFRKVPMLGRSTDSIAKELNECLCAIVINTSTSLRMLSTKSPNIEGARETARRTICCCNRAANAVSHLRVLFNETNKHMEPVAPSREASSRVGPRGTL